MSETQNAPPPSERYITIDELTSLLRRVARELERSVEQGYRSRQIDADDLVETLLTIADSLDPA